jgi:hypothetical protein
MHREGARPSWESSGQLPSAGHPPKSQGELGDEWSFREQARATAMIEGVRPDLTLQSKEGLSQPGVVPTGQGQCPLEPKSTAEQKWDWSQRQSPVTAAQGSVFPLHRARASPQQGGSWR